MKVPEKLFTRGTIRLYLEFVSWTAIAMSIGVVCSIPFFQEDLKSEAPSGRYEISFDEIRAQFGELPADDDGLRRWLAEQPGAPEFEVERTEPDVVLLILPAGEPPTALGRSGLQADSFQ